MAVYKTCGRDGERAHTYTRQPKQQPVGVFDKRFLLRIPCQLHEIMFYFKRASWTPETVWHKAHIPLALKKQPEHAFDCLTNRASMRMRMSKKEEPKWNVPNPEAIRMLIRLQENNIKHSSKNHWRLQSAMWKKRFQFICSRMFNSYGEGVQRLIKRHHSSFGCGIETIAAKISARHRSIKN